MPDTDTDTDPDTLADQLELELELECTVWTLGRCLDERDFDGLRQLFTADATVTTGETASGHDALNGRAAPARRRRWRHDGSRHIIGSLISSLITDLGGDQATGRANVLASFARTGPPTQHLSWWARSTDSPPGAHRRGAHHQPGQHTHLAAEPAASGNSAGADQQPATRRQEAGGRRQEAAGSHSAQPNEGARDVLTWGMWWLVKRARTWRT